MCAKPPSAITSRDNDIARYLSGKPARSPSRRLALWEIDGGMQCSVIGTCLSDQDLIATIRKNKLQVAAGAQSYDIHSYCVRAAGQASPFARSLNKLLDRRFAGALRLVARAETETELREIWARLRDSGQIGAAYWALMSHAHVPGPLKVSIFGEVHMLSHLNGHSANELSLQLSEAERRIADLEGRLRKSEQAKREALDERDAARAALSTTRSPAEPSVAAPVASQASGDAQWDRKLAKVERALVSARARARHAEDMLERASEAASAAPARRKPAAERLEVPVPIHAEAAPVPLQRRRILYLGGRTAIVPHLREAAQAREADFLHHDGGVDDNLHRIEEMIQACDVVVCPIDCVSHGACRKAKDVCHRLKKHFFPIATSSRSGFERALEQLSSPARPMHEAASAYGGAGP